MPSQATLPPCPLEKAVMRKIIHIDMDCFYAAVEVRDRPELKGLPVAVGGPGEKRGVITTANYEARKYGVRSALSTAIAIRQCPQLILVPPNMKKYAEESKKIRAIFYQFTSLVEPLSLDEAYLDVSEYVSGAEQFKGSASLLAEEIRRRIFEATGLSASAGIAPNKFLAKVASDWKKPNGQFTITPGMVADFVKELPIEKIMGVGKVTAKKIHNMGISTCGQLQEIPREQLIRSFGKFGGSLYEICRGIDHRKVITSRERKSVSIERTFSDDFSSKEKCFAAMPALYARFRERYHGKDNDPGRKTLFVKVKFSDFSITTAEGSFDGVDLRHFNELLKKALDRQKDRQTDRQKSRQKDQAVRLIGLGIRFKGKKEAPKAKEEDKLQLTLF